MNLTSFTSTQYFMTFLVCILIFWCIHFHWKRRRLYHLSREIPGPIFLPFIGSTYIFQGGDASAIAKLIMDLFEKYPQLSKVWLGKDLYYLISKPEYLEIILNHPACLEKFDMYEEAKPVIGNGLISGPVEIWKRHRKIIAPSLNRKILNEYPKFISEQCKILVEIIQKECRKGPIDHCKYITNCSLDIICETIFGVPFNAQITKGNYSHLFDRLMEIIFLKVFWFMYHFNFIFVWTKTYKEEQEIIKQIKSLSLKIINMKKAKIEMVTAIEENSKRQFLELMVEKYILNEFTQKEIEDEVNTFLLAGTDTNATTSSFVLTLLGMYPDIQEKLYEEVFEILGPDRIVTQEDLLKLKYTELVIKESLRLFPGVPLIGRVVRDDVNLGDVIIPKGSNILIGYLHLHRSAKYWDDPLKFNPDRFLPENSVNRHSYSWLPFSGGRRNCIGMKYGMMVMKIMIAMVIRKFKIRSNLKKIEDIELTTNIVLKPKNGFKLFFEPR